ncbi:hypothetical protein JD844_028461 [Phrynosoma platyrhinos]|uniref:C1q domain-containing protein n=1 Tax=Phrynosoma platyrhinos TaxID=52577 RepID=A0ABQ7SHY0_PHRPL|nr:hypothetical protein JD844_028461 [Phrynosoma platyrhinos]
MVRFRLGEISLVSHKQQQSELKIQVENCSGKKIIQHLICLLRFTTSSTMNTYQISGVYFFGYNMKTNKNSNIMLVKNGKPVMGSYQITPAGYENMSGSTILRLEKGDKVRLEVKSDNNGITQTSYFWGYLLFVL